MVRFQSWIQLIPHHSFVYTLYMVSTVYALLNNDTNSSARSLVSAWWIRKRGEASGWHTVWVLSWRLSVWTDTTTESSMVLPFSRSKLYPGIHQHEVVFDGGGDINWYIYNILNLGALYAEHSIYIYIYICYVYCICVLSLIFHIPISVLCSLSHSNFDSFGLYVSRQSSLNWLVTNVQQI